MCEASPKSDAQHVINECQTGAWIAQANALDLRDLMEIPETLERFTAQLTTVHKMKQCWNH